MPAKITYQHKNKILSQEGMPSVRVSMTAVLDCGCAVHMGSRIDNREIATGAIMCSKEHAELMGEFQRIMRESLVNPTDLPLHVVVQRFLTEAEDKFRSDSEKLGKED